MYASHDLGSETLVVIGSNKLRVTSKRAIEIGEIDNLAKRVEGAKEFEVEYA